MARGDDANSWSDESNVIGRYFSVFASIGLPSLFVYGVAAIELIGGLFMIIGFLIPLVSVGFIAVLVGAIFSFGLASGFSGYEYELFLAITSLAILVSYADKKYLTLKLYF